MPSVDELLNMAEVAEVTLTETNDVIEIDADTRTMIIPDTERIFGVMSDEKGERKYFRCKRFVGNGIDLSKLDLRVIYQNASGLESGRDKYIVTDLATDGEDYVTFSWELSRKVTAYKGIISFIVCAIKTGTDGIITNEWNTTLANGVVLDGLEVSGTQEQEKKAYDYYKQLEAELEKKAQEVIGTIPSDYTQTLKDVNNLKEEVTDGRTDVDGNVHKNIGDAMRGQVRKLRENLVVRQKEQPTDPNNNVWISDEDDEVEVPDMGEFNSLKEDINGMVTKHINYLLSLVKITGKFYNHKSTTIGTASEGVKTAIYQEIPINAGVTYYYRNLYAYFCNIVYNDGNIVALSETTSGYYSGSFTAEKNGKILITVSLTDPTKYFMFTDDNKTNTYYNFNENVYEPTGLRSLFIEPVLIQKTNYKDILPDCNTAKTGSVYRFNFAKNETDFPKNTPLGDLYSVTSICLLICFGRMRTDTSLGDYQLFFSDNTIYRRQYSAKLSPDGITYEYYWNDWNIVGEKNKEPIITPKTIVVDKNGNGDYTSLLRGILYATTFMESTVYVRSGEYNLVSEFEDYYGSDFFANYSSSDVKGIILKNRVSVIFDTKAHVTFNYTGDNNNVKSMFSPFNSGVYGFTLDNIHLEASNCRYNIHDERGSATDGYKNVYKNCSLYLDNSKNTGWNSKQCIGGGLGTNGNIIVENCIFESIGIAKSGYAIVSWHNSASSIAKSNIVFSGNYIKGKGTFRLSWYGGSTNITTALVNNNSLGSAIESRAETNDSTSSIVNTEIIDWNNVIRTD